MKIAELLLEIDRLSATEYDGGRADIKPVFLGMLPVKKDFKPLPGGSNLQYTVNKTRDSYTIKIWDPSNTRHTSEFGTAIGKLKLEEDTSFPIKGAYEASSITVDEDYRGRSIAKSLYGIAFSILSLKLLAGDLQTPGGRRNWVSLSKIDGVEVIGWVGMNRSAFAEKPEYIDTIMGELGAIHLGSAGGKEFFGFTVQRNRDSSELMASVNTRLSKIYDNDKFITGLFAQWVK